MSTNEVTTSKNGMIKSVTREKIGEISMTSQDVIIPKYGNSKSVMGENIGEMRMMKFLDEGE